MQMLPIGSDPRIGRPILRLAAFFLLFGTLMHTTQRASAHQTYASIAPYPGAPQCQWHDPMQWHGLWNPEQGCHYDHEHKDNPGVLYAGIAAEERVQAQRMLDIFGPPGAWFGGTSISYPWQTFMGAGPAYDPSPGHHMSENGMKHAGYGWIVRHNLPKRGTQWISDLRLQYHAIFAAPGATTRYHSYSLEMRVCDVTAGCRIVRTGGWLDFGHLRIQGRTILLPDQTGDGNRQRLHRTHNNLEAASAENFRTSAVWYSSFGHPAQVEQPWNWSGTPSPINTLNIALETWDAWASANPDDPYTNYLYCPAFDCNKNGSSVRLHRIRVGLPEEGFDGYTDRFGLINISCQAAGLDCIPTTVEAGRKVNTAYNDSGQPREFDVSPEGVRWIKYPN